VLESPDDESGTPVGTGTGTGGGGDVTRSSLRLDCYSRSTGAGQLSHGGGHDELKEWLTRRWESSCSDSSATIDTAAAAAAVTPAAAAAAGVKRKASDVLETPADSTDDVFTKTTSSRGSGATGGGRKQGGKVSKSNMLLASLLATRASVEQPVVNTLSIGSMATVTPQTSLLRRASADQLHSSAAAAGPSGVVGDLTTVVRKSSTSSVSAAGDTVPGALPRPPLRIQRSHSSQAPGTQGTCGRGHRRTANPMLADASLTYQDSSSSVDVSTEEFDMMDGGLCPAGLAAGGMDDKTLMSQFEQLFSSQVGGNSALNDLENLLLAGDSCFADLTSSLFDQSELSASQPPVDSQLIKTEPQPQLSGRARRGSSGLLGQLLETGGSGVGSDTEPLHAAQRPSSLAVSSAYCHRGGMSTTHVTVIYHTQLSNYRLRHRQTVARWIKLHDKVRMLIDGPTFPALA